MAEKTVREQLAKALEMMVPLLQSFDNWCRVDRSGLCQSHFGEKHCSVVAARRSFCLALDRHRAEPEERLYPERAVAPLRRAVQDHIAAYRKGGNLYAVAHWEAVLKPLDEPEGHCGCDGPDCPGYQLGLEAQREPLGGRA